MPSIPDSGSDFAMWRRKAWTGTDGLLSRRDYMMVARHEMPGRRDKKTRPVGYGMICAARFARSMDSVDRGRRANQIVPYGTTTLNTCPPIRRQITRRVSDRARGCGRFPWSKIFIESGDKARGASLFRLRKTMGTILWG